MKSPRDILVAGISFLLGMVVCYFLMAPKAEPEVGKIAMNQVPVLTSSSARVVPADPQGGEIKEIILDPKTWERILEPKNWPQTIPANERRMRSRIVPAYHGLGIQADLIDLDWVPDFEIDLK